MLVPLGCRRGGGAAVLRYWPDFCRIINERGTCLLRNRRHGLLRASGGNVSGNESLVNSLVVRPDGETNGRKNGRPIGRQKRLLIHQAAQDKNNVCLQ